MRNGARATVICGLLALLISGCSKKRDEATAPVSSARPAPTAAANDCRYESAAAANDLDIGSVVSMDAPADKVHEVLACAGAALQECAGLAGVGSPPKDRAEVAFSIMLDERGLVSTANVKTTSGVLPEEALACYRAILLRFTMPAPDKAPAEVRGAFRLTPRAAGSVGGDPRFAGATASIALKQQTNVAIVGLDRSLDDTKGRLHSCYLLSLENDVKVAGTVDFVMRIDGASVADVTETAHDNVPPKLVACVDLVLRNAKIQPDNAGRKASVTGTVTLAKQP